MRGTMDFIYSSPIFDGLTLGNKVKWALKSGINDSQWEGKWDWVGISQGAKLFAIFLRIWEKSSNRRSVLTIVRGLQRIEEVFSLSLAKIVF